MLRNGFSFIVTLLSTAIRNADLSLNSFCRDAKTFLLLQRLPAWSGMLVMVIDYKNAQRSNFQTELNW